MLATDFLKTADLALRHFGERRTDEKKGDAFQGVETPSQILISTKFLFCWNFFLLEILSEFKIFSKVNRAMWIIMRKSNIPAGHKYEKFNWKERNPISHHEIREKRQNLLPTVVNYP